jgi:hypothetical protein
MLFGEIGLRRSCIKAPFVFEKIILIVSILWMVKGLSKATLFPYFI